MFWHNDDIKLTGCILAVSLMRQTTPVQKPRRHTRLIASVGTPSLRVGVVAGHSFSAYAQNARVRKISTPLAIPLCTQIHNDITMTCACNRMLISQYSFGVYELNR